MPDSNIGPRQTDHGFPQKKTSVPLFSPDSNAESRTRLLVSVRSPEEAMVAAAEGTDIIDVKEPTRGPLGAADPQVWRDVAAVLPAWQPLSVALGEASDWTGHSGNGPAGTELPDAFHFAKLGPAGVGRMATLEGHWRRVQETLPASTYFVPVAYADWQTAGCPPPETILAAASRLGLTWWLLDTFEKQGKTVIDRLGARRLAAIAGQAKELSVGWVLAGSMTRRDAPIWSPWQPTVIGVRGDVCAGSRQAAIDGRAIAQWQSLLQRDSPTTNRLDANAADCAEATPSGR